MGRKALGEALRLTHHAIQDPGARDRTNEFLECRCNDWWYGGGGRDFVVGYLIRVREVWKYLTNFE